MTASILEQLGRKLDRAGIKGRRAEGDWVIGLSVTGMYVIDLVCVPLSMVQYDPLQLILPLD